MTGKNRRHRPILARRLTLLFATTFISIVLLLNIFGLRELAFDGAERIGASMGLIDSSDDNATSSSSVVDCSDSDEVMSDGEDAREYVSSIVNKKTKGNRKVELTASGVASGSGIKVYRFVQSVGDLPVYGRGATVAIAEDGSPIGVSSNCVPVHWLGDKGSVDSKSAIQIARGAFDGASVQGATSVLYARDNGTIESAWTISCSADDGSYELVVSALSGDVLAKAGISDEISTVASVAAPHVLQQAGEDEDPSKYMDDQRNIYILDGSKLGKKKANKWAGARLAARGDSGELYRLDSERGVWIDENGDGVSTGICDNRPCFGADNDKARYCLVDTDGLEIAQKNLLADALKDTLAESYDYYAGHLGYVGADGAGGSVYGLVDAKVDNAERTGWSGNPVMVISVCKDKKYYTLSTIAHEYTHGVIQGLCDLKGDKTTESSSLDESLCDIMSYVIRDEADNDRFDNSIEWEMDGIYRRADSPGLHPTKYRGFGWAHGNKLITGINEHWNSTVISHAAYLMCGNNNLAGKPITTEQLGTLTYLTMNMLSSHADFPEFARLFTMMAARLAKSSSMDMNAARAQRVISAFAEVNLSVDDAVVADEGQPSNAKDSKGAAKSQEKTVQKPIDIAVVLDASGSMAGEPETDVKKAASKMIDDIEVDNARFGACAYNSELTVSCALSTNREAITSTIDAIDSNGGTDIGCGLSGGYEILGNGSSDAGPEHRKVMVLMSDGLPTSGESESQIRERSDQYKEDGIKIYTVGFNLNTSGQNLMRSIADEGCYFNVADESSLEGFFKDIAAEINGVRYTYIRVACPVDVSVTSGGETLTSKGGGDKRTSFGTVQIESANNEDEAQDDEIKVLRLKSDGEYQLKIDGTGAGTMTVGCDFMDDSGDYNDHRSFSNVAVASTMEATLEINNGDKTRMVIDDDGDGLADRALEAYVNSEAEVVDSSFLAKVVYLSILSVCIARTAFLVRKVTTCGKD